MHKIRDLNDIRNDALLFTTDAVGLYPSISIKVGLQTLKEVLELRKEKRFRQMI